MTLPLQKQPTDIELYTANEVIPLIRLGVMGHLVPYHKGYLPMDLHWNWREEKPHWWMELFQLSERMFQMSFKGEIHLVQKKVKEFCYIYYAIKAREDYQTTPTFRTWERTRNHLNKTPQQRLMEVVNRARTGSWGLLASRAERLKEGANV